MITPKRTFTFENQMFRKHFLEIAACGKNSNQKYD